MAQPLTLLPPNTTWEGVRAEIARLPTAAPIVDLSQRLNLKEREEFIFVGATWSGKTSLLWQLGFSERTPPLPPASTHQRVFGVYDDSGQDDDQTIIRTVTAMLKFQRTQKLWAPLYKPIILLRNSTWHRIAGYFTWVPRERIGTISFPVDAYYDQLRACNVPDWLITGFLGPKWVDSLRDAHGHFLPKLAWAATLELVNQSALTSSKPQAVGVAAARYIREMPTFAPFLRHLTFVVPDDRRVALKGRPLELSEERLQSRLLSAMRDLQLPDNMSRPEFIRAAQQEGILRRRPQLAYVFSRAYAAGLVLLKAQLALAQT